MIDMFRNEEKRQSIDKRQAVQLLEADQYELLSTAGENGYTYGVPLNYVP